MNVIDKIKNCFFNNKVLYTKHALKEMEIEEFGQIFDHEIEELLNNCEIIESYENDNPYPSYLISGFSNNNRPLHIVVAYNLNDDIIIIITAYQPDPKKWENYKIRR